MTAKEKVKQAVENASFETIKTSFEAYEGKDPFLFVSYSHQDTKKVFPILNALNDKRFRIWYDDSIENGTDFRDVLREKIEACEAVLLFVSPHSMASPFCGMEIIVARENGKRLFPIFLEETDVPPAFKILLDNTQHSLASDRDKMMQRLMRDLPAVAMDRLMMDNEDKSILTSCENNGTSIDVDEGIRIIKENAFKNRTKLETINLPESLEEIGDESFRGCKKLKKIDIPEKTIRIGESAFRDCTEMKSLVIKNNCIKIGERAFENCSALESVVLPNGLTEIYGGVFNSCKKIRHIKLPDELTILGENAFSDCIGLEEIEVPNTVTKIDDLVFNGCVSLSKVILHEGIKKIGKSAFKNCRSLTQVELPASISHISDAPFRGCESLHSIHVHSRNRFFKSEPNKREGSDHVLFNKNKSRLIAYPAASKEFQYEVPDSVTVISDWAFSESRKLHRISIPDSVNEIGEGSFSNCSLLDEVVVPDSVEKIDDCAFRGCVNLERVIIPDSVTDIGWGLFDGCEDRVTVFCSENSHIYNYCRRNGIKTAGLEEADIV